MPVPGKYGRLPFDPEKPRLTFEKYLDPRVPLSRAGLPPVPWGEDVDWSSKVPSIPMYLNDQLGDCTIAGEGHFIGAMSFYATGTEVLFADSEIETVYSRVGGYVPGDSSTDNGCEMSDVLADAKSTGITDTNGKTHKLLGYAALGNPADEYLLAQCLEVFGSVYVGFNVQQIVETEFSDGQPWTWQPGAQTIGGHCVVLQRRYPSTQTGALEYWTWGARQRATMTWQARAVEEAWVAISDTWLRVNGTSVAGLDVQQLLADAADV